MKLVDVMKENILNIILMLRWQMRPTVYVTLNRVNVTSS